MIHNQNMIRHKSSIYDCIEYILAICIILNCRSMWLMLDENARKFRYIINILTVLSSFGCVALKGKDRGMGKSALIALGVLVPYLILYSVITMYNYEGYYSVLIPFISLYIYYFSCQSGTTSDISLFGKITNIVTVICTVSLFFWVMGSVLHVISPDGYVISKWTGESKSVQVKSYYNIHFEPQTLDSFQIWTNIARNSSIFAEAPMAAVVFSLSFLFEILLRDKPRRLVLVIIGAAVLTTLSVIGITIMATAAFIGFISSKSKHQLIRILKWLLIPFLLAIVIYISYSLVYDRLGTRSGSVRLDDFVVGYNAWINKPLFGGGFENNEYIKSFMSSWRIVNSGFSNSPMQILAQGGLYLALLYLLAIGKGAYYSLRSKDIKMIAFFLAFAALYTLTIISYQYYTLIMLLYFSDSKHKLWKEKTSIKTGYILCKTRISMKSKYLPS